MEKIADHTMVDKKSFRHGVAMSARWFFFISDAG